MVRRNSRADHPHPAKRLSKDAGFAALKAVELPDDDPAGKLLDLLREYAIYAPDTPTLRGIESDPISREPVGLAGGKLPEGVIGIDDVPHKYSSCN